MTQLSTGTEDRTGDTAAARSTSVDKSRHPGRRLFGNSGPHAPQPTVVPEQSAPVATPEADMWDEGRAAARSGNRERATARFVREAEARSRQGSHGRAAAAYTHAAGEGLR